MNPDIILREDNPRASQTDLTVYLDALTIYVEAADNVRRNGAICSHPRTGTPMDNPYLKVMASASAVFRKYPKIKSDRALAEVTNALNRSQP